MTAGERLQRCANCDGLTGKTTEDAIFLGEYGPFCEECADRLVAAAPEMLDALERLVDAASPQMVEPDLALEFARAVIRKARGEA